MTVLLDTNACIAVINGRPPHVRQHFIRTCRTGDAPAVSTITLFELWLGIVKSGKSATNAEQLLAFLPAVEILPFGEEDARVAANMRLRLMQRGKPIGSYDLLIASQAIRHGLTIVTANVREYSRVPGLHGENWETGENWAFED